MDFVMLLAFLQLPRTKRYAHCLSLRSSLDPLFAMRYLPALDKPNLNCRQGGSQD